MTATTILHEAEAELWEAAEYYESRSPGLGTDFQAEIEASVRAIATAPRRWALRDDGTRRCMAHRFPYLIVYVLLSDHVWVVSFAHCKRRPRFWGDRIEKAERGAQEYCNE
jgi:hypothetical protein